MKSIEQTYEINAPVEKVWQALTDPNIINDWGGGPAVIEAKPDTEFEYWGGDIHGKNTEVVENEKLVQEWFSGDWPEPSICTFELSQKGDSTTVRLTHTNIPDHEADDIETGWQDYFMGPLKELLEKKP